MCNKKAKKAKQGRAAEDKEMEGFCTCKEEIVLGMEWVETRMEDILTAPSCVISVHLPSCWCVVHSGTKNKWMGTSATLQEGAVGKISCS